MRGAIEVPVLDPITEHTATSFVVRWNDVEGAIGYKITLTEKRGQAENPADAILLSENFQESCYSTSAMAGNIANKLDNYLSTNGWTGENLYPSTQGLKMFKGSTLGSITTPNVGSPDTDHLSIYIYAQPESSSNGTMQVVLSNNLAATLSFSQAGGILLNTPEMTENVKITFTAKDKVYLGQLVIYDGDYDSKDLNKAPRKASTTGFETDNAYYEFTGMTTGSTYTVRVATITPEGISNWSAAQTIKLTDETSIRNVFFDEYVQTQNKQIYDLSGRRVSKPTKGIYIMGRRKVIR